MYRLQIIAYLIQYTVLIVKYSIIEVPTRRTVRHSSVNNVIQVIAIRMTEYTVN